MSKSQLDIVLVALGGYGMTYVDALLDEGKKHHCRIVGAVDPMYERCPRLRELQDQDVLITPNLSTFYKERSASLAIISSPIHFHAPQSIEALKSGSHVLCEKPAAATLDETDAMTRASEETGRFLAIGYQWSFLPGVQQLKQRILDREFGKPVRFKTKVGWPRMQSYYARNNWAGRVRSDDGRWILDSPANNATAHFLHNMLFLLGDTPHSAAAPATVEAELYCAKNIENYDTAMIRTTLADGVEILFYTTHSIAPEQRFNCTFELQCEKAVITGPVGTEAGEQITITPNDGEPSTVQFSNHDHRGKLWQCCDAARNNQTDVACDIRAASAHTRVINATQQSSHIHDFPKSLVHKIAIDDDDQLIAVEGLSQVIHECFDQNALPSELDVAWAKTGEPIDASAKLALS